jgi:hypothetical protein
MKYLILLHECFKFVTKLGFCSTFIFNSSERRLGLFVILFNIPAIALLRDILTSFAGIRYVSFQSNNKSVQSLIKWETHTKFCGECRMCTIERVPN